MRFVVELAALLHCMTLVVCHSDTAEHNVQCHACKATFRPESTHSDNSLTHSLIHSHYLQAVVKNIVGKLQPKIDAG